MVKKIDEPTQIKNSEHRQDTPTEIPVENNKKTKKAKTFSFNLVTILAILAIIISIIALGTSALFWQNIVAWKNEKDKDITQLHNQVQQDQGRIQQLSQVSDEINASLQKQTLTLKDTQEALQQIIAKLEKGTETATLEQVSYLLGLADLNLRYQHDINSAIILLENANERLATLNDPALIPLREEIAKDLLKLQSTPKVDVVSLISQLNTLSEQIPNLPLSSSLTTLYKQGNSIENSQTSAQEQKTWRKWLAESWKTIQKFIVIRHRSQPVEPLISPQEQINLIRNIQLQFGQAKWAVLHYDSKLYQLSLNQAQQWIQAYFDLTNQATKTMLAQIDQIKATPIAPPLPDISDSQKILQSELSQHSRSQPDLKPQTTNEANP